MGHSPIQHTANGAIKKDTTAAEETLDESELEKTQNPSKRFVNEVFSAWQIFDLLTRFTGINALDKLREFPSHTQVSLVRFLHYIPGRWMRESSPQKKSLFKGVPTRKACDYTWRSGQTQPSTSL